VGAEVDQGFLRGYLSGNVAIAFLMADLKERASNTTTDTGESLPSVRKDREFGNSDTVGISLGMSWWGSTPIQNLQYLVAADGYVYSYSDNQDQDISETVIRFKLGLSYYFDI
jgi:hypothetical protein